MSNEVSRTSSEWLDVNNLAKLFDLATQSRISLPRVLFSFRMPFSVSNAAALSYVIHAEPRPGIIALIFGLIMLFDVLGLSAIAAVATMVGQYLYQVAAARVRYIFEKQVLVAGDDRLNLTSEILQSVKTLKFFSWERGFAERLQDRRMKEMHALRKQVAVRAMISVVTCESFCQTDVLPMSHICADIYSIDGGPIVIALITFLFHTKVLHKPLEAATAFTALSLLTVIRAPCKSSFNL